MTRPYHIDPPRLPLERAWSLSELMVNIEVEITRRDCIYLGHSWICRGTLEIGWWKAQGRRTVKTASGE
jgi:hypothetical protein